mmetsp:Transcript_148137/g.369323  ORF Transcript_148137/g.369323 Transcript_148137/m.369323 type:complete len:249 (+) Transcript_148137:1372-2118(+)
MGAALWEYPQTLPSFQACVNLVIHFGLINFRVDFVCTSTGSLLANGGDLFFKNHFGVRTHLFDLHCFFQSCDLQLCPSLHLGGESRALTTKRSGAVAENLPCAPEGHVLWPGHGDAVKGPGQEADKGPVPRLLRNHEGDLPLTIGQEDDCIHELVVVVPSQDNGAILWQVLHSDDLNGAKEHVIECASEKGPHHIIQQVLPLVHRQREQNQSGHDSDSALGDKQVREILEIPRIAAQDLHRVQLVHGE